MNSVANTNLCGTLQLEIFDPREVSRYITMAEYRTVVKKQNMEMESRKKKTFGATGKENVIGTLGRKGTKKVISRKGISENKSSNTPVTDVVTVKTVDLQNAPSVPDEDAPGKTPAVQYQSVAQQKSVVSEGNQKNPCEHKVIGNRVVKTRKRDTSLEREVSKKKAAGVPQGEGI